MLGGDKGVDPELVEVLDWDGVGCIATGVMDINE